MRSSKIYARQLRKGRPTVISALSVASEQVTPTAVSDGPYWLKTFAAVKGPDGAGVRR